MSAIITSDATSPLDAVKPPRVRLDYLDGLRGLSALYVVLNHTSFRLQGLCLPEHHAPHVLGKMIGLLHFFLLAYGHYAVAVFIVLSGYCLMLPVVRGGGDKLPGGIADFIKRRARRIMPPYYAALLISFVFCLAAPWLHIDVNTEWFKLAAPVSNPAVVLSHLLLIHNWTPYIFEIDPPMWSVAVEWQIYFLFPLLLLPLFRRFGSAAVIAGAFAVPLIGHFIGHAFFDRAHLWFLGLFGMGMVAAALNFSPRMQGSRAGRLPWAAVALAAAALVVFVSAVQRETWRHVPALHWFRLETWGGDWPLEIVTGLAAAALILHCTGRVLAGTQDRLPLYRLLNSRAAVKLGVFSYSLYLIHDPVLECVLIGVRRLPAALAVPLMLGVGVPLAVGIAYLFHLTFEKRFMPAHFRAVEKRLAAPEQATEEGAAHV